MHQHVINQPVQEDNPTMHTNTNTAIANFVPSKITFPDLIVRGGGIPDEAKPVVFVPEQHQFKSPGVYADKPMESVDAYRSEVEAMYEMISHNESFPYYGFNDVAVNFTRLLRSCEGGIARSKRVGLKLPSERQVEIGYDSEGKMRYETIPGDWMTVPGLEDAMARVTDYGDGTPVVQFQYRRFCQEAITGFLGFLHDKLRSESIYKGQAIRIDGNHRFEYVDVSKVDPTRAVYSADVFRLLQKWCLSPITNRLANDEAALARKSNVVLGGLPGTGKTVFLNIIKKHAVDYQWTAIEMPAGANPSLFEYIVNVARVYMDDAAGKGCVVVAEDIEKWGEQDRAKTLDVLDGGRSKNDRLVTVMTTNFPEQLDPAMVRAERINALIDIPLPDQDVYERLVRMRLGPQLADEIDWEAAFAANEGYTPAWIIGGLESVIRGVIARTGTHRDLVVQTEDLVDAANDYRPQFIIQQAAYHREPEPDTLAVAFGRAIQEAIAAQGVDIEVDYDHIRSSMFEAVEYKLNQTAVQLETERGNAITGNLSV